MLLLVLCPMFYIFPYRRVLIFVVSYLCVYWYLCFWDHIQYNLSKIINSLVQMLNYEDGVMDNTPFDRLCWLHFSNLLIYEVNIVFHLHREFLLFFLFWVLKLWKSVVVFSIFMWLAYAWNHLWLLISCQVAFAKRALEDPELRAAHNVHKMSSVLGGALFIADDVFPDTPFLHAAWHLAAAVGVGTCNKLL